MEHPHNGILFSVKSKGAIVPEKEMEGMFILNERSQSEKAVFVWFQLLDILEKTNYDSSKKISDCQR